MNDNGQGAVVVPMEPAARLKELEREMEKAKIAAAEAAMEEAEDAKDRAILERLERDGVTQNASTADLLSAATIALVRHTGAAQESRKKLAAASAQLHAARKSGNKVYRESLRAAIQTISVDLITAEKAVVNLDAEVKRLGEVLKAEQVKVAEAPAVEPAAKPDGG